MENKTKTQSAEVAQASTAQTTSTAISIDKLNRYHEAMLRILSIDFEKFFVIAPIVTYYLGQMKKFTIKENQKNQVLDTFMNELYRITNLIRAIQQNEHLYDAVDDIIIDMMYQREQAQEQAETAEE